MFDWKSVEMLNSELISLDTAGLPMPEGLRAAAERVRRGGFRKALDEAARASETGRPISEALAAQQGVFPCVFTSMVRAGEEGGNMSDALQGLAKFLETRRKVSAAFTAATIYPSIVLTFAVVISAFVTFGLVPDFLARLSEMRQLVPDTSPLFPRFVGIAFAVQQVMVVVFALLWLVAAALCMIAYVTPARRLYHSVLLRLPLYGRLFRSYLLYHLSAITGLLTRAGAPLPEALDVIEELKDSPLLVDVARAGQQALQQGRPLSSGFASACWFPRSEIALMASAEKQERLADYLDDLGRRSTGAIGRGEDVFRNSEPAFVAFLAVLVALYAIAVFVPVTQWFKFVTLGD